MLSNIEFIFKAIFLILSIIWIGRIMILRSDKQIIINPVLIGIASLLAILPSSTENIDLFGISINKIRMALYIIYSFVVIFGIYATNKKNGIF